MAFATTTATTTSTTESTPAPGTSNSFATGDAAIFLMGALAGAAASKEARKQFRAMSRKMAWQAMGYKFKSLFNKKYRNGSETAGMPTWLFVVLVIAAAAIGVWLFGLLGFLIVLGLGVIIYLLVNKS